ncbi:hypothetical protein EDD58_103137 [Hazenella coriacea]|uniref:Uncharacterized protein n=1 Tax=Hazenella coriacea TaxID=1179467 RepID=A0A4R3L720_9BACL|nr:hypothetical protein EDD58_103137 [Hazenella coriacea]
MIAKKLGLDELVMGTVVRSEEINNKPRQKEIGGVL